MTEKIENWLINYAQTINRTYVVCAGIGVLTEAGFKKKPVVGIIISMGLQTAYSIWNAWPLLHLKLKN